MGKPRKRGLDGCLTVLGYLFLLLGIYFVVMGTGVLLNFDGKDLLSDSFTGPGSGTYWTFSTVATIVVLIGLGVGFVAIWWWLSGLPIRRWWWRRQDRKQADASGRP